MSFALDYDLFINVAAPGGAACLLDGKTSSPRQVAPSYIQADKFPLNLYFRKPGAAGTASTPVTLANLTIVLGAKLRDDLEADELLFNCTDFALVGTEDNVHYQAILDLNTDEIADALTNLKSITARVNVEVETAGNAQRLTYQFDVTIQKQSYGGEASPTPGTPIYPLPALLVTKIRGTVAINSGASVIAITGLNLGSAPAQVLLTIRKPTAGAENIVIGGVLDDTVTADGFQVELAAPTPEAGYKLDYLVIL